MIYVVISDNFEVDDCWHGAGSSIEYISLDKEKAENYFEKMRQYYKNMEDNDIDTDEEHSFTIYVDKWSYNYDLLELPLDTDLRKIFT